MCQVKERKKGYASLILVLIGGFGRIGFDSHLKAAFSLAIKSQLMNPFFAFLTEMAGEILTILGVAYVPLIVMIVFRAGRMRGLTEDNMAERLGDLCFDTIKEQIVEKIQGLLQANYLNLPPGLTVQQIGSEIHGDSEALEELLTVLRNLTEGGFQSQEFQQALEIIAHF